MADEPTKPKRKAKPLQAPDSPRPSGGEGPEVRGGTPRQARKERKDRGLPSPLPLSPRGERGSGHGGWLGAGGAAGRKPAEVRAEILATVGEANALMRSILDGEFRQEIRDAAGDLVGYRTATIHEIIVAWKALTGHALPTRQELTGKDGGPVQVEGAGVERARLMDRLDDADLELAGRLAEKAHADPDA